MKGNEWMGRSERRVEKRKEGNVSVNTPSSPQPLVSPASPKTSVLYEAVSPSTMLRYRLVLVLWIEVVMSKYSLSDSGPMTGIVAMIFMQ